MKARMPSMKDSSDPVETSRTRTRAVGRSASRRATSSSDTTPVALSFAPGTTFVEPICPITAAAPAETIAARDPGRPAAGERSERGQRGAAEDGEHQRRAGVAALDQRREPPPHEGRDRGVEDQPGLGGVVVGDEHDRPSRILGAHLRDDVERVAFWQ